MSVRYVYQLIQALDGKIGPDLRRIVEQYLGPDREEQRLWFTDMIPETIRRGGGKVVWEEDDLQLRERLVDYDLTADYLQPKIYRLLWRGRQIWRYDGAQTCYVSTGGDRLRCHISISTYRPPEGQQWRLVGLRPYSDIFHVYERWIALPQN